MSGKIYQIKISLSYLKPKIWRRLLIPADILLPDLHKVIQTAMGWTNSHLHQFIDNKKFYCLPFEDDEMPSIDYREIKLSRFLKKEKDRLIYEYDFGDGWQHEILLEKILPPDKNFKFPVCLEGKRNCPPEDVGGFGGYENLLEILKNPADDEYESYIEWLGGEFDPEYFDINEVNELLKEEDFGCI